jgi:hypothetical protein
MQQKRRSLVKVKPERKKLNLTSQKSSKTKMVGLMHRTSSHGNPMISLSLETPPGLLEAVGGMDNLLRLLLSFILDRGNFSAQDSGENVQGCTRVKCIKKGSKNAPRKR